MVGRVRRKERDGEQMAMRRRRSLAKRTGQDAARLQGQGRFTETPRHHSFDIAPDLEDPSRFNHDPCTLTPKSQRNFYSEYVSTQILFLNVKKIKIFVFLYIIEILHFLNQCCCCLINDFQYLFISIQLYLHVLHPFLILYN